MNRTWTSCRTYGPGSKIDVRGIRARLYVHDQEQPALVVNDLKTGAQGKGGVGLWVGSEPFALPQLKVQP